MMSSIASVRFRKIVRPLRTVFRTSLGSKSVATSVLIEVSLADGAMGVGEVPTSFAVPHETPGAIKSVLVETRSALVGVPIEDYLPALAELRGRFGEFHMTLAGLEVAMFRAALATRDQSEPDHWKAFSRSVETDITVAFTRDRKALSEWLRRSARGGFKQYKVKVSGEVKADIELVKAVREELDRMVEGAVIRLDGNQGYSVGYGLLFLVLAAIGATADLTHLASVPILVLAGLVWVIIHGIFLMTAGRLLRAPLALIASASQANIGGVVSAPVVAEVYQTGLAPVALLLGVLGNILGTYLGLCCAALCRMLGL